MALFIFCGLNNDPVNIITHNYWENYSLGCLYTVYPKKYAHGFVVLCFVVVMQSFIMNLHEVFIHIHQGCFAGTGAIVRLPQCQWSRPDGYGKISQCITTTKHSKAKTVCIFLGYTVLRKLFTWMPLYNLNFQFVMEYMVMPFASNYRNTHPIHHIYVYIYIYIYTCSYVICSTTNLWSDEIYPI